MFNKKESVTFSLFEVHEGEAEKLIHKVDSGKEETENKVSKNMDYYKERLEQFYEQHKGMIHSPLLRAIFFTGILAQCVANEARKRGLSNPEGFINNASFTSEKILINFKNRLINKLLSYRVKSPFVDALVVLIEKSISQSKSIKINSEKAKWRLYSGFYLGLEFFKENNITIYYKQKKRRNKK